MCGYFGVTRSAYYRWLKHPISGNERENGELCALIRQIHTAHPDMGYRRIRDELTARYGRKVNDKRVLRLCRKLGIQSTVKWRPRGCTRGERSAKYTAENLLAREFHAEKPNEKWVTDVTEFKYYTGTEVHKVYLSAILDLCDRRLVAYKIRNHNDNELVMATIDEAVGKEAGAHPLVHSDRGFQYTSPSFRKRLEENRMRQSMSRVGRCIDNGPMEGFWGILKREMYYGRRFTNREDLVGSIEEYIEYYNNERIQRKLQVMSPMKYHEYVLQAA